MIPTIAVLVSCLGALQATQGRPPPAVAWATPGAGSTMLAPEGHAWVLWTPEPDMPVDAYVLERRSPGGSVPEIRRVGEAATFIAGLPEGTTQLRVRAVSGDAMGPWSEPLLIDVSYPSRGLVRTLALLGSLLLAATVLLIIVGHRGSAEPRGARPARPADS